MRINTRGGMWTSRDDDSKIQTRVEPGEYYGEVNFFGSFEVSIGMSEKTMVRCRDLLTEALRDMHDDEGAQQESWLHKAAPTTVEQ
jgi:hypothetical protein